nr:MAG TPA: hypothetical protein [Caudoviricetes sp.]
MAKFQKKDRRLVIEFGENKFFVDVINEELQKGVIEFAENSQKKDKSINDIMVDFKKLIEIVLGKDAYSLIKKTEYDNKELNFYELMDICEFILDEINNYNVKFQKHNQEINNRYNNKNKFKK